MALLRPCVKLMQSLTHTVVYRAQCIQRFILNSKEEKALILCILNSKNKRISYKRKQSSTRFVSHYSITKNIKANDNNSPSLINLLNRIEILSNEFKNMKIDYDYLNDTIKLYAELNEDIDSTIDIFILNCCGRVLPNVRHEVRQKLASKFWNILENKNRVTSLNYYHTLINIYEQNHEKIDYNAFIKSMKVEPNENIYLDLLQVAAKTSDSESTDYILSELKKFDNFKNLNSVHELPKDPEKNDRLNNVILKNVDLFKLQLLNEVYGNLACGYALQGDIENVIKILDGHSLNHKQLLMVLKNLCLSDKSSKLEKILKYIPIKEVATNRLFINMIYELVHLNKINEALMVVDFFAANNSIKNSLFITKNFLQALIRADIPESNILNIAEKLSRTFSPETVKYILLEESLRCENFEFALLLLESIEKNIEIRPHYYWPILIQAFKSRGETGVFGIIDHMRQMQVRLDYDTLLHYIFPHINTLDPLFPLQKLLNRGLKLHDILIPLVSFLLENGRINAANFLLLKTKKKVKFDKILSPLIKALKYQKDAHGCAKLLLFSASVKDYPGHFLLRILDDKFFFNSNHIIKDLISSYKKHKICISNEVGKLICEKCTAQRNKLEIMTFLKDSDIVNKNLSVSNYSSKNPEYVDDEDELKCHLIELKSKGLCYDFVLRKLFMIACDCDDSKQVELIESECKKRNIELTASMKASLIGYLARHGKIEDLCSLLLNLRTEHPDFILSPVKILQAAVAFVNCNKIELAWELINNSETSTNQSQQGSWKLLNSIACSKHYKLTNLMLNTLIIKNFCKIDSRILEPLITQHLIRNDLPSAIRSFQFVANRYQYIPMHQKLVYDIIKSIRDDANESYKSLLKSVLNVIYSIGGQRMVDMDLIIAYVKCNMLDELKTAIMNLQLDRIFFDQYLINLSDEEKSIVLMKILEASSEIDWIDRQPICESLLKTYSNLNDRKGVIELWKIMKNEGIKSSAKFDKHFSTFLLLHKIQIPNSLITRKEFLS
ncbi:leucine-rich PPR motif-containing protein, mitochondrial [Microplitis demolitor]|uniref:leucine-rich PPR motif-containing protein, mitochondrial n=1 Tax=Microplitis demolitor TaxID=69319 RepID=UPI0004CDB715|nr:leucine-rich PPR motif-containing protein, mitochondrial [Microplitis demolitor]